MKPLTQGRIFLKAKLFTLKFTIVASALIALTFELHAALTADATAKKLIHKPLIDPALAAQLAEVEKLPTIAADAVPRRSAATYYSAQCPYWPPLPGNIFGLPLWDLGDGHYLVNDLALDYSTPTTESMGMSLSALDSGNGGIIMYDSMQSGVPYLTITATNGNQALITVLNDTNPGNYELWWTPVLADPNYPWTLQSVGLVGQTNFIVNMSSPTAFFRAVVGSDADGDGVPNYMDGDPNNAAVGALTITIDSPLNGSVFN